MIKLSPPIQSPKFPVYNAGYRSTSSVFVFPAASVPDIVACDDEFCARAVGSIAPRSAQDASRTDAHDAGDNAGKRAIAAKVESACRGVEEG